jgi:hypothetical protein
MGERRVRSCDPAHHDAFLWVQLGVVNVHAFVEEVFLKGLRLVLELCYGGARANFNSPTNVVASGQFGLMYEFESAYFH